MGSRRKIPETAQLSMLPEGETKVVSKQSLPCPAERFLKGDPNEIFIGSQSLHDYLEGAGKGWVIRFRTLLFAQDAVGFFEKYKATGRRPYHPFVVLGLILYGLSQGRTSLRQLEDLGKIDLAAWWICGGMQPDHSTIGEFIQMHAALLTDDFFVSLTSSLVGRHAAQNPGVAGDGTVIEAASSRFSMLKKEAAAEALKKAKTESGQNSDRAKNLQTLVETVDTRNAKKKSKGEKPNAQVCPDEPDAVLQLNKNGTYRPSYKPSILADRNRMILGQSLAPASEMAAVSPMLNQYEKLFGASPAFSLWDGNYNNFEMLGISISLNMDLLCGVNPDRKTGSRKRFLKSDFTFKTKADCYFCPAGRRLVYRKSGAKNGRPFREYQCKNCADCSLRSRCTKSKSGRSIIRYEGEELKEIMREIMKHPAAKKKFRHRKAMVEPVFGTLRYQQGLTRFHRKGAAGVRVEFSLHCMAYNLRRALRLEEGAVGFLCSLSAKINDQDPFWSAAVAIFWTKERCFIFVLENEIEEVI
jgi:transposase